MKEYNAPEVAQGDWKKLMQMKTVMPREAHPAYYYWMQDKFRLGQIAADHCRWCLQWLQSTKYIFTAPASATRLEPLALPQQRPCNVVRIVRPF